MMNMLFEAGYRLISLIQDGLAKIESFEYE
jgi:hypothetical protein